MIRRTRRVPDVRRSGLSFTSEETEKVVACVSQLLGDEKLARSIQFSPTVISNIRRLLAEGGSVITDTGIIASSVAQSLGGEKRVQVKCFIDDPEVLLRATSMHTTRAEVALDMALGEPGLKLLIIGSAPAALNRLLVHRQHEPLTDVSLLCTVNNYAAAIQLKERLRECDMAHIVTRGKRGGVQAAAVIFEAVLRTIREKR